MKKLLMIAVIAVITFSSTYAQDVSFGPKFGANFASLTGDDTVIVPFEGRTGIHFGAVINIGITERFGVQPEVVYSEQGYTLDQMGNEGTGKLNYINIPVLADFKVVEGLSLQGGPQIGINMSDEFESDNETQPMGAESADFGVAIGAQYRLPVGLFVQARYSFGLSKLFPSDSIFEETLDIKNQVFSISAGWFF